MLFEDSPGMLLERNNKARTGKFGDEEERHLPQASSRVIKTTDICIHDESEWWEESIANRVYLSRRKVCLDNEITAGLFSLSGKRNPALFEWVSLSDMTVRCFSSVLCPNVSQIVPLNSTYVENRRAKNKGLCVWSRQV